MSDDLVGIAEAAIDSVIRSFRPGNLESYAYWDAELMRVEGLLMGAEDFAGRDRLLASVRAQRIELAVDVDKVDVILSLSENFIRDFSEMEPGYFNVAIIRARCLHEVGSHEEEVQEVLGLIRRPDIHAAEYIPLLEHIAVTHPARVPQDRYFFEKMNEAIESLRQLGYQTLPGTSSGKDLGQVAMQIAAEIRRVNRERGEGLLRGSNS